MFLKILSIFAVWAGLLSALDCRTQLLEMGTVAILRKRGVTGLAEYSGLVFNGGAFFRVEDWIIPGVWGNSAELAAAQYFSGEGELFLATGDASVGRLLDEGFERKRRRANTPSFVDFVSLQCIGVSCRFQVRDVKTGRITPTAIAAFMRQAKNTVQAIRGRLTDAVIGDVDIVISDSTQIDDTRLTLVDGGNRRMIPEAAGRAFSFEVYGESFTVGLVVLP